MSLEEVVEEARKLLDREKEKYGGARFEIVAEKAEELAQELDADENITLAGIYLMDVKTPEALSKDEMDRHVEMSLEVTKEFLEEFNLDKETEEKIINCVKAHHFNVPFKCKEAEICANADCYRFLHPRSFLKAFAGLKDIIGEEKTLNLLDKKVEEKYENISLDVCREEVEKYYPVLKKLLKYAGE